MNQWEYPDRKYHSRYDQDCKPVAWPRASVIYRANRRALSLFPSAKLKSSPDTATIDAKELGHQFYNDRFEWFG